jgi:hypothetical protein
MSDTLTELEQKLNVVEVVREHPWPALAVAVGAGVLLSGSSADIKAAAATAAATRGASSKVGAVLDDMVASLLTGLHSALEDRVTSMVGELKTAIGAPAARNPSDPGLSSSSRMPGSDSTALSGAPRAD